MGLWTNASPFTQQANHPGSAAAPASPDGAAPRAGGSPPPDAAGPAPAAAVPPAAAAGPGVRAPFSGGSGSAEPARARQALGRAPSAAAVSSARPSAKAPASALEHAAADTRVPGHAPGAAHIPAPAHACVPAHDPAPAHASSSAPAAVPATLEQLEARLRRLEEQLSGWTVTPSDIRIETLHLHQPVLENLTFRLDALDIKELSGSLNLGNNFAAAAAPPKSGSDEDGSADHPPARPEAQEPVPQQRPAPLRSAPRPAAQTADTITEAVKTATGFHFKLDPKPQGGG